MMDLDFRSTSSSDRAGLLGVWTASGLTVGQKEKKMKKRKSVLLSLN